MNRVEVHHEVFHTAELADYPALSKAVIQKRICVSVTKLLELS